MQVEKKPDTITFMMSQPPMVDYNFKEIKPVTVRKINKFLVGDGRFEQNIRDRFEKSKVLKDNSIMDIRDPRLQTLLKDRKGLDALMKTADQTNFLETPVHYRVDTPWGKDWKAFAIVADCCGIKIATFYQESKRRPEPDKVDLNKIVILQNKNSEGKPVNRVVISAESNQAEDMQIIGAEYDPETGKVKPETIGEAYGSYNFEKKKNHNN